jgi:hypothetical protein
VALVFLKKKNPKTKTKSPDILLTTFMHHVAENMSIEFFVNNKYIYRTIVKYNEER